jgi:hypothetical protein
LTASALLLACFGNAATFAQVAQDNLQPKPAPEEKAEQVLKRAIEVLGGSSYLNVRSAIGRGYFTQFKDGASGLPASFVDYVVYPDRERTEFKSGGLRIIQTNTGESGWIYDGATKTIKDITPEQVEDFKIAMRVSVEMLLRGQWRKEGAKLSYLGRREAGVGRRNEAVRLVYPDGLAVEFEFGARDGLPAKVIYKKKNEAGEEVTEEDRLAQFVAVEGITSPFIIDHYRAGAQTSRINYKSIEYNMPVAETLFARPINAKAVK